LSPIGWRSGGCGNLAHYVKGKAALVLICCHLAKHHHELIRRAIALLEQLTDQNREPHQAALLGDYLDTFHNTYQDRMEDGEAVSPEILTHLALKLLIDLLFYGSTNGARRLWIALLDRSITTPHPTLSPNP
jgi:Protein of unknown function (DUF3038)